jgi:hypothetical protein
MIAVMRNFIKIGAFARILGCDAQTIRRLDRLGLFAPRRDRAGHRLYDVQEDAETVRAIRATHRPGRRPKVHGPMPKPRKKRALDRSRVGSVPASPSLAVRQEGDKPI